MKIKIKKIGLNLVYLAAVAFIISCEKVIEVPLNDADRQIVVEAVGRNFLGESYVILSRSGSVYDDSDFEKLSGAIVTITDQDANEFIFLEDITSPGRYVSVDFIGLPSSQYTLKVVYGDQTINATNNTLYEPVLDSLTFLDITGGFGGEASDTSYLLFYNFKDNVDEVNYYQISAWVNGERDDNFYLGTDVLGNGQAVAAPLFGTSIGPRDTVYVELRSMDEASYIYLSTLASNINSSPFSATPSNPVTNLDSGLGFFSVYMVDSMTIIMP